MSVAAARPAFVRLTSPVRNRRDGFSPLKIGTLALLCLPGLWLGWSYFHGDLGSRPVLALVHGTGRWTVRLVLITLALSPARRLLEWQPIAVLRRMVGVAAACYAGLHVSLYAAQQNFRMLHVASEIIHRFYLAVGSVALLGLMALAVTSTDATVRSMGRNWKRLHRAIYAIAALGLLHFFLQAKADVGQAVVLAGLLLWLLGWRLLPSGLSGGLAAVLALGVLATVGAGAIEIAWYGLTTGISPHRVLMANFQFHHPRPSAYVALWSIGTLLVVAARRMIGYSTGRRRWPERAETGTRETGQPVDPRLPSQL